METTSDGAGDLRARRKVQRRNFVTVGFATKARPDGFELVCEAARSVGMEVRTYIRTAAIRASLDDVAKARASKASRKAG